MADPIIFKVVPSDRGWRVTRNDQVVAHYPSQSIAQKAAARQARSEANKGNRALAFIYKKDGTVADERLYSRHTTPLLGH